jgi:iron complex outermembrane receptor protein
VTPRASVVWRWNDRNIVKAQYAEGFRPPTFFELYTPALPGVTPHYPFEVNATTELNYIHKTAGAVFRSTLFQTRITDMLRPGGVTTPGSARARGFELEYSQQITPRLKLDSNVSRVTTRDPRHDNGPDPAAADWLANLGVMYEPIHDTFLGAHFNHVGGRSSASGYDLFDVTVSRHDLFIRGVGVRVGVKNAFNDHPVYLLVRPVGAPEPITFPGRSVWMQLSWKR